MSKSFLSLGRVVITSGINSIMSSDHHFAVFVYNSLIRHAKGDWGEVGAEDHQRNEMALIGGIRIFSVYECAYNHQKYGCKIYIITESDRSVTTILWPREY